MRARGDGGSGGEGGEVRGRAETIFLRWSFKQVEESEVEGRAEGHVCEKKLVRGDLLGEILVLCGQS